MLQTWERAISLDVEAQLNGVVAGAHWLEVATSYWYAGLHYVVTPLVLGLLYRRAPGRYRPAREALVLATGVALIGYLAFPTAPPRLVAGYVDVLSATADVGWWSEGASAVRGAASAVNQLAAMPSMHVGWALWCGLVVASLCRHRWQRVLAFAYPLVTTLVVIGTANHWVLDAVAGAVLVWSAWWIAHGGQGTAHIGGSPSRAGSVTAGDSGELVPVGACRSGAVRGRSVPLPTQRTDEGTDAGRTPAPRPQPGRA